MSPLQYRRTDEDYTVMGPSRSGPLMGEVGPHSAESTSRPNLGWALPESQRGSPSRGAPWGEFAFRLTYRPDRASPVHP